MPQTCRRPRCRSDVTTESSTSDVHHAHIPGRHHGDRDRLAAEAVAEHAAVGVDASADAVSGVSISANTRHAVALTVFLADRMSMFALFISAYTIRMEEPDWRPVSEPALLWFNTGRADSREYRLSLDTQRRGRGVNSKRLKPGLIVSGALTIAFLLGQLLAWAADERVRRLHRLATWPMRSSTC